MAEAGDIGGIGRARSRTSRALQTKADRRTLLKLGAVGAGVAVATRGSMAFSEDTERGVEALKSKVGGLFNPREAEVDNRLLSQESATSRLQTPFELVYPYINSQERKYLAEDQRQTQILVLKSFDVEQFRQIREFEPLTRESASNYRVPEELMLGLVAWESKGDPKAESFQDKPWEERARGLTQIMVPMAKSLGLHVEKGEGDERYKPEKVLPLTAQELRKNFEVRWGNWGFAVWEWHVGTAQIYKALKLYIYETYGENLASPIDEVKSSQEVEQLVLAFKNKIAEKQINLHRLFKNNNVKEMFSGPLWDQTDQYVPRILAAADVYRISKDKV